MHVVIVVEATKEEIAPHFIKQVKIVKRKPTLTQQPYIVQKHVKN